jgi:hypothetical protein
LAARLLRRFSTSRRNWLLILEPAVISWRRPDVIGIGLVFLAIGIIGSAGTAAAKNGDLKLLFGVVDHYPVVVFIGTALMTLALQSSTASIGLGIGPDPRDDHGVTSK